MLSLGLNVAHRTTEARDVSAKPRVFPGNVVPILVATSRFPTELRSALVTSVCTRSPGGRGLYHPRPGDAPPPASQPRDPATRRPGDSCQSSSRAAAKLGANGCGAGEGREDACTNCTRHGRAPLGPAPPHWAALAPHGAGEIVPLPSSSRVRGLRPGEKGGRATVGPRRPLPPNLGVTWSKLQILAVAKEPVSPYLMSVCFWGRSLVFCPNSGQTHPPT